MRNLLFLGNSFHRTDPGAGAAALTFNGIDPALPVFFGNSFYRTFAVTGTAVYTGVSDFISHIKPLSIKFIYNISFFRDFDKS
jgi:hypothetical protein